MQYEVSECHQAPSPPSDCFDRQPPMHPFRGNPFVNERVGWGFSHNWCFVCQHTSPNSAPIPFPLLPLRILSRGGECLLMLHSILCALNRRQSPIQVRLRGEGCILVPGNCNGAPWQMGSIAAQYYRPEYVLAAATIESGAIELREGDRWRGIDVVLTRGELSALDLAFAHESFLY